MPRSADVCRCRPPRARRRRAGRGERRCRAARYRPSRSESGPATRARPGGQCAPAESCTPPNPKQRQPKPKQTLDGPARDRRRRRRGACPPCRAAPTSRATVIWVGRSGGRAAQADTPAAARGDRGGYSRPAGGRRSALTRREVGQARRYSSTGASGRASSRDPSARRAVPPHCRVELTQRLRAKRARRRYAKGDSCAGCGGGAARRGRRRRSATDKPQGGSAPVPSAPSAPEPGRTGGPREPRPRSLRAESEATRQRGQRPRRRKRGPREKR